VAVGAVVDDIVSSLGSLDVAVNNVGMLAPGRGLASSGITVPRAP